MKRFLALSLLIPFVLSACGGTAADKGPIKIGAIFPLTGDGAAFGSDVLNAVKLAQEDINAKGGINGRTVEIVAEDGRCTPSDAASAAQKLTSVDKVVAIVGGVCSAETMAIAPIVEAAKIVELSPTSSSPNVTKAGDFVFRDYPSDALKTKAMTRYFADRGFKKVAILATNSEFSIAFRDALKKDAGSLVVFDEVAEPDTKDFRSLLTRLKKVDFDVFVADAHINASMAAMIQQFREMGFTQQIISHDVADTLDVVAAAGPAAEKLHVINVPTLEKDTDFGKRFTAKYGEAKAGLIYAALAYDAVQVLAQAMNSAGTEGPAIRDYLYKMPAYKGIAGTFSFDKNGDVKGLGYALKEVQNGKFVTIGSITVD